MIFLLPLIYFLLSNGLLVYLSKRSFGKCLPLTMMINSFTYFFSQILFHTFKVGFYINLLYSISFLIIIIIRRKKKEIQVLKTNFFSKGFYAFIIIYFMIYIFDFNRVFSLWDEYSHWGVMIKEMLRLDQFYSVGASTLMVHKDYPPIIQLLELFFCQL